MKELEELTREIQEKLPRLIYEDEFELFDESNGYRHTEKLFIPEPPMLNDVLDWFKNSQYKKGINLMHELIWSQTSEHILKLWDLSKPYLKDQSPELIEFLHGFIKK